MNQWDQRRKENIPFTIYRRPRRRWGSPSQWACRRGIWSRDQLGSRAASSDWSGSGWQALWEPPPWTKVLILDGNYLRPCEGTGWDISYRKYILRITQPCQYRYTKLQYRFAVTSWSPSMYLNILNSRATAPDTSRRKIIEAAIITICYGEIFRHTTFDNKFFFTSETVFKKKYAVSKLYRMKNCQNSSMPV